MEFPYVASQLEYKDLYSKLCSIHDFGQQIALIRSELLLTTVEINARRELVEKMKRAIKASLGFHNANITIIGSTAHPLGFKGSGLDLNLEWNKPTDKDYNSYLGQDEMNVIMKMMHQSSFFETAFRPEIISGHEIPTIIMQWTRQYKIHCNLVVNADYTVQQTRLISYFSKIEPMFTDLAMVTLMWMKSSLMMDYDRMNTFSVILMVVFYMQKRKLLPCVCSLQNKSQAARFEFEEHLSWKSDLLNKPSIEHLFMDFFIFYGQFNCDYVISPNMGSEIPKASFNIDDEHFTRSGYVIQNPFNLRYTTNPKMAKWFGDELVEFFNKMSRAATKHKSLYSDQKAANLILLIIIDDQESITSDE